MKWSGDGLLAGLNLMLIAGAAALFTYEVESSEVARDRPVIGRAAFIDQNVQRRPVGEGIWNNLAINGEVYHRDYIRTAADGFCSVLLSDGIRIELGPDSLIMLYIGADRIGLNFRRGNMQVTGKSGQGKNVTIAGGDSTVTMQSGQLQVNAPESGGLAVQLESGSASIQSGTAGSELKAGSRFVAYGGEVTAEKLPVLLTGPVNGQVFYVREDVGVIDFTWVTAKTTIRADALEISSDRFFAGGIRTYQIHKGIGINAKQIGLPAGRYFWRMRAVSAGDVVFSETRRLQIKKSEPVYLTSPADGEVIQSTETPLQARFAWLVHNGATGYHLDIADNKNFKNPLQSVNTVSNIVYITFDTLPQGELYWRVRGTDSLNPNVNHFSATNRFKIEAVTGLPAADLRSPPNTSRFARSQGTLSFNWFAVTGAGEYEWQLATAKDFSETSDRKRSSVPYISYKNELEPGIYYWRVKVSPKAGLGKATFSDINEFEVLAEDRINLFRPTGGTELNTWLLKISGHRFSWQRPATRGDYIFEIALDKDFETISRSLRSKAPGLFAKLNLAVGSYYWRVSVADKTGNRIAVSPVREFEVSDELFAPPVVAPADGEELNLAKADNLTFQWGATQANAYRIRIYRAAEETKEPVLVQQAVTTKPEYVFTNIKALGLGEVTWNVQSLVQTSAGKIEAESGFSKAGFVTKFKAGGDIFQFKSN